MIMQAVYDTPNEHAHLTALSTVYNLGLRTIYAKITVRPFTRYAFGERHILPRLTFCRGPGTWLIRSQCKLTSSVFSLPSFFFWQS